MKIEKQMYFEFKMFELENFVHCPRSMEGIKQSGLKEKILKMLL
jgi:hypothetical protein